jgi:hypothetical protein
MKVKFYSIGLIAFMIIMFSQPSAGQFGNFYSSSGYSNMINTLLDNAIWKSSMGKYTKEYYEGKHSTSSTKPNTSRSAEPEVVPEYRRYPAVQFKSTGTRLTLQEYLDSLHVSAADKEEFKQLILKIFKDYEAAAKQKGLPNDWALAYVSFVGINTHVYRGITEGLLIPFEQNVGLRDVVAEQATDNGLFKNVTDRQKQELYEVMVMVSGLVYHFYEKAIKENNEEEIKNCKRVAQHNLELMGIRLQ